MRYDNKNILTAKFEDENTFLETFALINSQYLLNHEELLTIIENNKHFNLTLEEVMDKSYYSMQHFHSKVNTYSTKVEENAFIRRYVKAIFKENKINYISQTKLKSTLSAILSHILYEASFQNCTNLLNNESLDYLLTSISEEEHLKVEFNDYITKKLLPHFETLEYEPEEQMDDFFELYPLIHAKYLWAMIDHESFDNLAQIKTTIQSLFMLNEEELSKLLKSKLERLEKFNQDVQEQYEMLNGMTENPGLLYQEIDESNLDIDIDIDGYPF